jgi:hypothetical protein
MPNSGAFEFGCVGERTDPSNEALVMSAWVPISKAKTELEKRKRASVAMQTFIGS